MEKTAEVYFYLGDLFGVEKHAKQLASYTEKVFAAIEDANIPESEKVTIYYANESCFRLTCQPI